MFPKIYACLQSHKSFRQTIENFRQTIIPYLTGESAVLGEGVINKFVITGHRYVSKSNGPISPLHLMR
jgi:hypothetical protein